MTEDENKDQENVYLEKARALMQFDAFWCVYLKKSYDGFKNV